METTAYKEVNRPLIEQCKAGDRKAQYELYKLYAKAMFNVSMRITNDYAEAEDVLQESFLSAFQHLNTYKGEVAFGSWLKKIVINKAISIVRKRRLKLEPMEEQADCAEETVEEDVVYQVDTVRKTIQKLPDGYRVVLSLYLLEGYDHQEIAEVLQITEATSKSQYSRAKKKLLELIRKDQLYV